MNITSIEITNVKGIAHQKFDLRLIPNKPNLLVAPNGFGKSSIATTFASMNLNRGRRGSRAIASDMLIRES